MVVLGTSPLAMFLAYVLQQNNIDVAVFSSLKKDKKEKDGNYIFNNSVQSCEFLFDVVNKLDKKPEYCFLASSIDEYKNDLLSLSDEMLRGVKVVNFASFYNHEIIEQMENVKEVRAYFAGWLVRSKKNLNLLNRNAEIKLCCNNENLDDFQQILNDKKLNIKQEKNTKRLFVQSIIPWFLGNLMILAYQKDISVLLSDNDIRQKIDDVIKEMLSLLKGKERHVDEHSILPDIYAFPDKFVSEFDDLRKVAGLSELIKGADSFNSPKLIDLMAMVLKKY